MAIYHFSAKPISRGDDGRSAVACAAYRSGEELHDKHGKSFKFKHEDRVVHKEIIAPEGVPDWATDRSKLWNSVEAVERRKDARLSREFQVALPHELSLEQQVELIDGWVREQVTPLGLVVDVAIHDRPGSNNPNTHAHLMATDRPMDSEGWAAKKDPSINTVEQLDQWRSSWAEHTNKALSKAGFVTEIDHRSFETRGIHHLAPTIHEGYEAQKIEERGGRSWLMEINRQIRHANKVILDSMAWMERAVGLQLSPATQAPAPKKTEPAPAPITAKPEPVKPPTMPPPAILDAEAEKRKKDYNLAARLQQGGGGRGG
jgi:ATP-dependent exoDNAse (exonuclease V) alpha subunit